MTRSSLVGGLALASWMVLFATGCGATTRATESRAERIAWTNAELAKLDSELRAQVRRAEPDRLAVKVFFHALPSDGELSDLQLARLGHHAIGQVDSESLFRIAARRDVERIEALTDVGY